MTQAFGPMLRRWRLNKRLTQEQLAFDAEVSTRHFSCLETGKARPSREMVLVLASALELELRDRNVMLGAAGFAPAYAQSGFDSLAMAPVERAIDLILEHQEPYGAVVVDRLWNVVRSNAAALRMTAQFVPEPPEDPAILGNLLRSCFHPKGMRACMVNWAELAAPMIERVERACALSPDDAERHALCRELQAYPGVKELPRTRTPESDAPVALVHLKGKGADVRLFTMVTTLGTPLDVTAQDLTIETYFPADSESERWLKGLST